MTGHPVVIDGRQYLRGSAIRQQVDATGRALAPPMH
jgi:hypothetical protein